MTLAGGAVVGIVGRSPAMQRLEAQIDRLAAVDLPVLIQGESGSGKEVVARELHRRGPRRNAPFVAVNCAAIPEGLFESELFGHERGSFTDASQRRRGHFERAGEGTLLLDEVGDLPSTVQAKLLRALQDRQFYRIGAESPIEFRARILSATALELEEDPRFRTDLYHRIAGARLRVPALRERREDLPDLCRLILGRMPDHGITGIGADAIARLAELEWPGNVRQLENLLGQIAIFAQGPVLDAGALEPFLHRSRGTEGTWFQEALRVWVTAQRAAGHSAAELREELLDRLRGIESQIDPPPNQGTRPKPPRP
jgi:DNA-binding NtrC family response regulator